MIFVNFKTYRQASGEKGVNLAKICQEVSAKTAVAIISLPQVVDLWRIRQKVKIPLWLQHLDWQPQGAFTGFINLEAVRKAGASGTILNHSEHPLPFSLLKKTIKMIRRRRDDFSIMICARNLVEMEKLRQLNPNFFAYEPAELIGSQTKSVATSYPEVISQAAAAVSPAPLIVGAGIKSPEDVKISLRQGAKGILLASSVVLASSPKRKLLELARAFRQN